MRKPTGFIKTVDNGIMELEVLAIPFGSPTDRDDQKQYFTPNTNIMTEIGDKRPAVYYHGVTKGAPIEYGQAELIRKDYLGWWFKIVLPEGAKFAKRLWKAAQTGALFASTGTAGILHRVNQYTGEITTWGLGEVALIDTVGGKAPANWNAVAIPALKAIYLKSDIEIPGRLQRAY